VQTRAAVLDAMGVSQPYASSKPLAIETLELDPPGPGELLLRLKAAGLCHSDLSVVNGDRPRPMPMALGHEAAGTVEQIGPVVGEEGASDLAVGDHVVCVFVPSCGHCEPCTVGRPALCEPGAVANGAGTLLSGARRLHRSDGTAINHHLGVSAFADYATVSRRSVVKIDPELPFDQAALFGCAVLTGVGAVFNTARLPAGSSAAVIGLGGVGLSSLLGAIAAGARQVVAIDLSDEKLAFARELGASETVNAADPAAVQQVKDVTHGGVEYAFELAGSTGALDLAFRITTRGGTTVTAGLPPPTATMPLPPVILTAEERTLKGSYIGTAVPGRDIPHYIELFRRGRLPVDRLMSGMLSMDEINEGFDRLHDGQAIRQVVSL
jgi:alcohol dehydrogenase